MDDAIAGITVEFIPAPHRSHILDRWRVCQDGGRCWLCTDAELAQLADQLGALLDRFAGVL